VDVVFSHSLLKGGGCGNLARSSKIAEKTEEPTRFFIKPDWTSTVIIYNRAPNLLLHLPSKKRKHQPSLLLIEAYMGTSPSRDQ